MKNLNPRNGLRQIITGGIYITRYDVIDLVITKKLTPNQLAYFLMFLVSADWDPGEFRQGYIRHDLKRLARIWGKPYTTVMSHLKKLTDKNVILNKHKTPQIANLSYFNSTLAKLNFRKTYTDEFIDNYFKNLDNKSEKSDSVKLKVDVSIKDPIKGDIRVIPETVYTNKVVVIRQEIRSDEEYEKLYRENPNLPLPKDMRNIDMDPNAEEKIVIRDLVHERQIVDMYFNGNIERYAKCLIYGNKYGTM